VLTHVGPDGVDPAWPGRVGTFGCLAVDLEVGVAAEQVVVDARSVGLGRVDAGRLGAPEDGGFVARHGVFLLTPVTHGQDKSNNRLYSPAVRHSLATGRRR
jgi:hypothetical protein